MNAPLVSWAYLSSLLGGFAVAPTRGAFIINDFLRNSHFKDSFDKINYLDNILSASFNSVCIFKEISLDISDKIRRTEIYQIICSNIPGGWM